MIAKNFFRGFVNVGNDATAIDADDSFNGIVQNRLVACRRLEQWVFFLQGIVTNFNAGGDWANIIAARIPARFAMPWKDKALTSFWNYRVDILFRVVVVVVNQAVENGFGFLLPRAWVSILCLCMTYS